MKSVLFNFIFFISSFFVNLFFEESDTISNPVINPSSGTYPNPLLVSITCETPGVTIYYTTTGNTPVVGTSFTKVYSAPFTILESTTVKALAVSADLGSSSTTTSLINILNPGICSRPVFSEPSGQYEGYLNLSMSTSTVDGIIWYTTNGNTPRIDIPNSFTKLYQSPINIYESMVIKAMTVKNGLVNSPVVSLNYTITNPKIVSNPFFNLTPGQYPSPQTITLSSLTQGASIYYTTNGNVPNIEVPNSFTKIYTTPLVLTSNTTVRAIAVKNGWKSSAVSVSTYYFCN